MQRLTSLPVPPAPTVGTSKKPRKAKPARSAGARAKAPAKAAKPPAKGRAQARPAKPPPLEARHDGAPAGHRGVLEKCRPHGRAGRPGARGLPEGARTGPRGSGKYGLSYRCGKDPQPGTAILARRPAARARPPGHAGKILSRPVGECRQKPDGRTPRAG